MKFIIPHGGGAVPFHWGRFRGIALNNGKPELAEIMGKNIFFDTCVYHQPGIDLLTQVVPVDNILFASEMVGAVKGNDPTHRLRLRRHQALCRGHQAQRRRQGQDLRGQRLQGLSAAEGADGQASGRRRNGLTAATAAMAMKFGLFGSAQAQRGGSDLDSGQGFRDFIEYNVEAEALGYDSTFVVEHHFTGFGQVSATLNLLTWVAASTKTLRLGTAVIVLPWHNPVLLAEQAATIDLLSGGRLEFGVGKGYRHNEFASFCIPMEEAEERFEESLALIVKSWTSEERFSHHGKFWNFENIVVEPPTAQKPHPPIWMAAGKPGFDPQGGAARLQAAARPACLDGARDRALQHLQGRGRGLRPRFDPMDVGGRRAFFVAKNAEDKAKAIEARLANQQRLAKLAQMPGGNEQVEHAVVRPDARCRGRERDVRHAGRDRRQALGAARRGHRACAAQRPGRLARESARVRARRDAGVRWFSGASRRRAARSRNS